MLVLWLALAFLLVAIAAGAAFAALRGLQLWRLAKRTAGTFSDEVERISDSAAQIERHLSGASAAAARLSAAADQLARSRARLDVQLGAVREARASVRRMLWFVPGL